MRKAPVPAPPRHPGNTPQSVEPQRALWPLLDALALCRRQYDLTASSLAVLRALISFLPKSTPAGQALIVWPSNRSLCERADGMDERTLRRHLERLTKAGLIHRHASSNGKRFALRLRTVVVTAFGFDLRPLLESANEITALARQTRDQAEQTAALRVEILNLLAALRDSPSPAADDEEADIRRALRRRPDLSALLVLRDSLLERASEIARPSDHLTASNRQIDRHQQKTGKDTYDSVTPPPCEPRNPQPSVTAQDESDITLADCLKATTESRAFAQSEVRSWTDMMRLAETLAPMIGIDRELADHAKRAMGPLQAAISILCLIQRSDHIQRPAAYLRKLAISAENGAYSLKSLVRSALRPRFAAANHAAA